MTTESAPRPDGTRFDVVGIGNALVDVLSHEDDALLATLGVAKGTMTLIDTDRAQEIYAALSATVEESGGSAANTMAGIASFGGAAAFLGKVFDDDLGAVFAKDLADIGVSYGSTPVTNGLPTGRSMIIVTPDAQRTMNTYLGASSQFGPDDVDDEIVQSGRITYLEGYLFDGSVTGAAYRRASDAAHAAGRQVALTLSDTSCVERNPADWQSLIADAVDILFANEAEFEALYGSLDAGVEAVRAEVGLTCITFSAKGSMLVTADETIEVSAEPVAHVVDTTGAGDQYAAGVLYGLTQGLPLASCGRLGSLAAAEVISHMGARPHMRLADLL